MGSEGKLQETWTGPKGVIVVTRMAELERENRALRSQVEAMESEIYSLRNSNVKRLLTEDNAKLSARVKELEAGMDMAKQLGAALVDEKIEELKKADIRNCELQAEVARLREKCAEQEREITALKVEVEACAADAMGAIKQREQLESAVKSCHNCGAALVLDGVPAGEVRCTLDQQNHPSTETGCEKWDGDVTKSPATHALVENRNQNGDVLWTCSCGWAPRTNQPSETRHLVRGHITRVKRKEASP